jgi:23S rRNA (uracil1939-C5)-methyltransferase
MYKRMQTALLRMQITFDDISPSGEAIGRCDGLVVFAPFGLPGETAEIDIVHRRKTFARGRITNRSNDSSLRVQPRCKHFGVCGGCEWQHIRYDAQVTFKTQIVREQLTRIGKLYAPNVRDCIPSPIAFGYRNRIQLAVSPDGKLGYRGRNSHHVIEIDECPIADPRLNAQMAGWHDVGKSEADLRLGSDAPTHPGEIMFEIGAHRYRVSQDGFFQINTLVTRLLVDEVIEAVKSFLKLDRSNVLDLYCGVGLFTLPISEMAAFVLGVEQNPHAVVDARLNAPRATFITADVKQALREKWISDTRWDAIVLDPPRVGIQHEALTRLIDMNAPRLVYVSCDPATLARDAKLLCERGYRLDYAQPLDMFPQTHHVETVAVFVERASHAHSA